MEENQLIGKIKELRAIMPRTEYGFSKKLALFSHIENYQRTKKTAWGLLSQSLNLGFSIALTSLFLLLGLSGTSGLLKTVLMPNFPGIDGKNLLTEADTIKNDINIHLNELNNFTVASEKTTFALREASINNNTVHVNSTIIQKETQKLKFNDPTNNNIDKLLKQDSL